MPTDSVRESIFRKLLLKKSTYLKHYVKLDEKFATVKDLKDHYKNELKQKIERFAREKDQHYKFWIYCKLNPTLEPSPLLNRIDDVGKSIVKFRLGSHKLSIETGRWHRQPREQRLCSTCNTMGDEHHAIYNCIEIVSFLLFRHFL